uniref:aminopeptidase n=1 Tax=uncultured Desulfovibrio sp. TaxID=167968 RepID=UPI002633D4BD
MDDKKRCYARFLLTRCLSMNAGEPLLLSYLTEQKEFVRIVKEEAKKLGITEIRDVEYDGEKTRDILMRSTLKQIEKEPYFDRKVIKDVYDKGGSLLSLTSYSKPTLNDVPIEKKKLMNKIKVETQEDAVAARGIYKYPWCIAAVATDDWANKLNLSSVNELWDIIFKCTLIDKEDPIKAWNEKIKTNTKRRNLLNELKLSKLKYKNSLGTDLEIGLPKDVIWWGAAKKSFDGKKDLIVNMPTEEVYTTPDRNKVNGTVCSSRPLTVKGKIIDQFKLTFKNGKVEKVWASNDDEKL